jgi:hypothetical protein
MKKANYHRYPFFMLLSLVIYFAIWLGIGGNEIVALATGVGAVTAFFGLLLAQRLKELEFFDRLFVRFTDKFSEVNQTIDAIVRAEDKSLALTQSERDDLFEYFNLCGEEYFYFRQGSVPDEVWVTWKVGMKAIFADARVIRLWDSDSGPSAYYGFDPRKL